MQARRGRPSKPKAERRIKPLRILLAEVERSELDAFAKALGTETSTWARGVLLQHARRFDIKAPLPDVR
jgi:hypothetical protein